MFTQEQIIRFQMHLEDLVVNGNSSALDALQEILCQARATLVNIAIDSGFRQDDAEDLVQETLRQATTDRALRRLWERFNCDARPDIYLNGRLGGMISDYMDYMRRRKSLTVSLEAIREQGYDIVAPAPQPGLSSVQRQHLWQVIRECVEDDLDFQILYLKIAEEMKHEQIAELLCVSCDNVRGRYSDAVNQLRQCLEFRRACVALGLI
jgi:RNA polymerase sigma factor (sigma-70 family)